ncbi:MAG: polysaccharide biosynthesis/export family protein [Bacteroidaceae bacterium]|nr:polysaccharide biosynthesis/export family protein [Bacteroidaceae bacterium]
MKKILAALSFVLLFTACSSTKEIAYFQDIQKDGQTTVTPQLIKLRPQDKITILVNTRNQELTNMFNLPYVSRQLGTQISGYGTSQGVSCYTIDDNGDIDFPELGKIHVEGMTRNEVAKCVKDKLISSNLVKDAVVTVEFANLSYSILGEVKTPARYNINRDYVTILDAISEAGDLTIQGQRTNIKVLRNNEDGEQQCYIVNLCSLEDLYKSPAYYLQQNDIVYVEPNKMRARQSTVNGNNVRSSSFWMSLASLIATVINIAIR